MCTPDLFLLTVMWAKLTRVLGFRLQGLGFAGICRDMKGLGLNRGSGDSNGRTRRTLDTFFFVL